ncbi:DsbA family protein [Simulacricoccus sp. 17bor-14]|nr:DsbA family protein [Simulacricoccus sp. 17bor-14]
MRRRQVEREFAGQVRFERRVYLLLPGEGQRPVYDDYLIQHRLAARSREPSLGWTIPEPGLPYPKSSVPAQLLALRVQQRTPERLEALEDALFRAVFVELADVAAPEVLRRCCTQAGVDTSEVEAALQDPALREQAFAEHAESQAHFIQGIPALLLPGMRPITGAVDTEVYRQALRFALSARR